MDKWRNMDTTRFSPPQWKRWTMIPITHLKVELTDPHYAWQVQCRYVEARVNDYLFGLDKFRERFGMATPKRAEVWQTNWVKVELTEDQKKEFRAWDLENDEIIEAWAGLLSGEYKSTQSYNQANSTYQFNLICNAEKSPNTGMGVSGYGKSLWDAICICTYKALVILPDKWADYIPAGDSDIG